MAFPRAVGSAMLVKSVSNLYAQRVISCSGRWLSCVADDMTDDNALNVAEIARTMLRHYGDRAYELMQDRSRKCRPRDELASAALWDLAGQKVRKIKSAVTC